jgi:hypothetical protein
MPRLPIWLLMLAVLVTALYLVGLRYLSGPGSPLLQLLVILVLAFSGPVVGAVMRVRGNPMMRGYWARWWKKRAGR